MKKCILVNIDNTFVQTLKSRVAWLKPFRYEIEVDDVSESIIALLKEEIDTKVDSFGKYEEEKARITIDIKIASTNKKRKVMIEDLEGKNRQITLNDYSRSWRR